MADKPVKLTPKNVARIAEKIFGMPVSKVTAPGGKSRESLRVHFPARTIVATQRSFPGRMRLEVEVLRRLTDANAPVPRFLGGSEQIFFQEDVGSRRLSGELLMAARQGKLDVAAKAIESLIEIRQAGEKTSLAEIVPGLGETTDWIKGFVGTVVGTSDKFKIAPPALDFPAVCTRLHVPPTRFIKWDARPGNGAVGDQGRVYWFDWEHCGKRQGMEDFAWLAGDEFWPVGTEDVVSILSSLLPADQSAAELDYLSHFITFHIVQRLTIIHHRFVKAGWVDAEKAMRYDKIGVDPDLAIRLCRHGAGWAERAELTRPMVRWFEECAVAIKGLVAAGKT